MESPSIEDDFALASLKKKKKSKYWVLKYRDDGVPPYKGSAGLSREIQPLLHDV